MTLYLFSRWCYFIRKRRPVSYGYSFEDLLALLHGQAPAKVDAVARHHRRVEHGCLSVGLKIHCLGDGNQFSTLVQGLGGAQKILDVNYYKHCHASLCLVLPPVGSARSAILLLECIEHFIGSALFSNSEIQIQVCSPGRLDARRSNASRILIRRQGLWLGSAHHAASSNHAMLPPGPVPDSPKSVKSTTDFGEQDFFFAHSGVRVRRPRHIEQPRRDVRTPSRSATSAEILAAAAYPRRRSPNAVSVASGFPQICATFQRDNLRRRF